jgi:hypothetical protein
MIFRAVRRFTQSHKFVKPLLSNIQNPEQLLYNKDLLLKSIKRANMMKLNPKEHSPIKQLIRGLSIEQRFEDQLRNAEFTQTAYDGQQKPFIVTFNPYKSSQNLSIAP